MSRFHRGMCLVILLAVALAGCSASTGASSTSAAGDPSVRAQTPVATYPPPAIGMDAAFEGTLRVRDDCVVIEGTDGNVIVPIFPADEVSWSAGVLSWRDKEYKVGEHILLGGGGGSAPDGYLPEGCAGVESFLVSA